jgi:allophanate hydrolase subunit 2
MSSDALLTSSAVLVQQVRGYLAVAGGLDVPVYLGSRSTFPNGAFGGYQGRYLRPGDSLPIGQPAEGVKPTALPAGWKVKYAGEGRGSGRAGDGEMHIHGMVEQEMLVHVYVDERGCMMAPALKSQLGSTGR